MPADVTLRIGPVAVDVAPGKTVHTTGYNGGAPGPPIRLREGIPVTVDLFNDTDIPEYVHWHGFPFAAAIDGTQDEKSLSVPPHGHLRYRMTPRPAGSRWVHSHVMTMDDLTVGMYSGQFGFAYVEPEADPGRYDQEIFLATHEWEPFFIDMDDDDNPSAVEEFGETDWGPGMVEIGYRIASINGKALGHGEPIRVKEGQRVLFHILNASATENIQLALPGHEFLVTALDGNPVPRPCRVPSLDLGAAERIDAIVEMSHPGVWVLGSTDNDTRGAGLGILVEYAGHSGVEINARSAIAPWDYAQFGLPQPQQPADVTLPMVITRIPAGENGFERWEINGRSYRAQDPPVVLRKDMRYRFAFHNTSSDAHPLHLHRSSFELTRIDGRATSGLLKDVVLIGAGQRMEVDFTPRQDGLMLFHCHNQFHMERGFQMLFDVR
ncbi:multicopper oxidase domain-containing protein [Acidipila sp. 4G-K13]|uniref:Copper oxidase n=2 Tax=Paracidobacterium acidisoli TaxID=2303751 RepID=A0A372IR96_9BACT|nr:multicopper oxidase domain-containing protein [Paracidobacterium acidisoli]MBT9331538.1 multicopper oxidase domain-containing protein [Paracidobacterium acidisoli]